MNNVAALMDGKHAISALIFANAAQHPKRQAIECDGISLSYAELAAGASCLSRALHELGIKHGEHIGVALPNCIEFALLLIAAADLGAVLVPISPALPAAAVQRAFAVSDVRHIIAIAAVLDPLRNECAAYMQQLPGLCIALEGTEGLPGLDMLSTGKTPTEPLSQGKIDDPYILTMTSGSTGDPKPIVFTQRTKLLRARATIDLYSLIDEDRILAATPMYHSLALRLTLMPLMIGATAIIMPRFSVSAWLDTVSRLGVTFTIAVSSQLAQIAKTSARVQVSSLRCVVSSSALLETSMKEKLTQMLGCAFHECYGTSETATATDLAIDAATLSIASVGLPLPGVDLHIVDAQGQAVATGEEGEILCRTPLLFSGYYKRPDLTQQAMLGDYFRTGDAGRLDADGYLYFLGRLKEIIITGGINVYPRDIEEKAEQLPWVHECAAFALPDEGLGEIVALAVVANVDAGVDLRMLKMHCAEHLADYQQPRKIFIVDTLPRNAMGKLVRRELSAKVIETNGAVHG